jgi:hypothetical protein
MGSYSTRLAWENLRIFAGSSLSGTFQPVGGPLIFPSYIAKLVNNSMSLVTISIDGINAMDVAPASSFWLYDEGKGQRPYELALPAGTQIYVSGTPGTGNIYFVSQYIIQL